HPVAARVADGAELTVVAAAALVRRLRLTGVGRLVADPVRARAIERRAVAGRRPGTHAVVALIADGAELTVLPAGAVVRGLRLAGIEPLVAHAGRARPVERRAVAGRRPGTHAVVALIADGAGPPAVAATSLVGRLRLPGVGSFVADAGRARPVEPRAIARAPPGALPAAA